jgi:hypothetical protein
MNSNPVPRLPLGISIVVLMASCTLPPREAWRQIRTDGLISFVANGMSAPKAQLAPDEPKMLAKNPAAKKEAAPVVTGIPVEGLKGYVRTPHTSPTRLVNVQGVPAGGRAVCPYTQLPIIVSPESAAPVRNVAVAAPPPPVVTRQQTATPASAPAPALAEAPKRAPAAPQSAAVTPPAPKPPPATAAAPKPAPAAPQTAATTPPPSPKPAPSAAATPAPKPAPAPDRTAPAVTKTTPALDKTAPSASASQPKPTPPPASAAAPAPLPYGVPIPGRPGFVNSPFAERHQLVDVTGLKVGTEVKCPYSGKSFRVPPQDTARR